MALLIAPYNNGMRIGQGFNSYTQQICIDDAVVIDPARAENIITNDGTTMRTLAEAAGNPSAWTRIKEVLPNPSISTSMQPQTTVAQARDDVAPVFNPKDTLAAATTSKAVGDAASKYQDAYTDEQMATMRGPDVVFNTKTGLGKNQGVSELTGYGTKSVSQTVIHTSRFVEKLSEVTDDMNITGALSIKAAIFGGSGRGAYIDTNKFEQSDLNFYISVKVINQSVNFKDALKYQPLDSVDKSNFVDVFGDTFISGFLEGGEFNALVSMKILNSAKKNVIAAEARVALSVPIVEVTAEGRVNIAKSNINTNAETTIQVSWSGGGHIKDANEQWDVDSLIRAASRFPDLVARSPQRIYAMLSKYESLRSFLELKPPNANPLDYENAKLYTNSLMDSYMTYKSLYQECGTAIFDVQSGAKRFISAIAGAAPIAASQDSSGFDLTPFPPTLVGLDQARREIRHQMNLIVKEVKLLTNNPVLASDPTHQEPSQSPVSFQARLPKAEVPRIMSSTPLSGQEIVPDPVVEDTGAPELFTREGSLTADETTKVSSLTVKQPSLSRAIRMTAPVGDFSAGSQFCFLDFLREDCLIHALKVEFFQGACTALTTTYTNGLVVVRGKSSPRSTAFEISNFSGDHLIAGSIEVGTPVTGADTAKCVTSIKLYTNRGRSLIATANEDRFITGTSARRDGIEYSGLSTTSWDSPLISGFIKGFWGRSNENRDNGRIYRLGFFWGDVVPTDVGSVPLDENQQYPAISGPVEITGTWGSGPGQSKDVQVTFSSRLPETPQIIWGIKHMDATNESNMTSSSGGSRARLQLSDPTPAGCKFTLAALSGTSAISGSTAGFAANYLTLPKNGVCFDTGTFDTSVLGRSSLTEYVRQYIPFSGSFTSPPIVRCWFTAFDLNGSPGSNSMAARQVTLGVAQRTCDGFTLTIQSVYGYTSASIGWLAYDSAEDGKRVRSDQYVIESSNADKKATVERSFSDKPFAKVPATFVGCDSFNVYSTNWVRWRAQQIEVTKDRFRFECGAASSNGVNTLGFVWIAME